MIDLTFKRYKVGTQVKTRKGFVWTKIAKDTWKDETSKLIWLPEEPKRMNHHDAMKLDDAYRRLPSKEEFEEAEKHGIREFLDMDKKWYWSSLVHPKYSKFAYGFNGFNGSIGGAYRNAEDASIRFIQRDSK